MSLVRTQSFCNIQVPDSHGGQSSLAPPSLYRPPQVGQGLLSAEGSCTPDAGAVRTPQCSPEYLTGVRDSPNFSKDLILKDHCKRKSDLLQRGEGPTVIGGGGYYSPWKGWETGDLG